MTTTSYYSPSFPLLIPQTPSKRRRFHQTLASIRRHNRPSRLNKTSRTQTLTPTSPPQTKIFKLSEDTLQITLKSPSNTFHHFLHNFIHQGREALDDLRSVVSFDNSGVVVSCRRSTIEFVGVLLVSSLVIIVGFRVLFSRFFGKGREGSVKLVYKRDRSLGGKEVLVGTREANLSTSRRRNLIDNPLSSSDREGGDLFVSKELRNKTNRNRRKDELPKWWPCLVDDFSSGGDSVDKEEYQKVANLFVRAIMDSKMGGQDISINDIVQLRHICKTYGVKATIDTENTRNSLYRASINFVLSYCEGVSDLSTSVQINGEDAREFIAGLADNIGLERARAARMVSAAVAARTRSKILQAWALEVQNKHSEALVELFRVCLIHRIFPPEESSPEMEMVARGLEKSLNADQREQILNSFLTVCGEDIDQSVVEALGLVVEDELGNQHAQIQ